MQQYSKGKKSKDQEINHILNRKIYSGVEWF